MKRYDTMGFESEHGVWVRAVDAEARIRELEVMLHEQQDHLGTVRADNLRLTNRIRELEQKLAWTGQMYRDVVKRKLGLEDALSHINLICACAPPHEELKDHTYNGIIDAIQRLSKK